MSETEFGSGDAVAVVDARLRVTEWNAAAEGLTGVPTAAALGRHCWEVLAGRGDDDGIVCQAGCRLALRALHENDVEGRTMLIATPAGIRRVWMATVAAKSEGRARILHVFSRYAPPRQSANVGRLTAREREVLSLLGEGLEAAEIADRLGVSVTTVRTHIRHILSTLGVRSQLAAVASTCAQSAT